MRYAWNRPRGVDAQVVGEAVSALAEEHGGVCPTAVIVDAAREPASPLHRLFEWDDLAAAEAYRREQARHFIRELRVVEIGDDGEQHLQAFVHVVRLDGDQPKEGYRLTRLIVRDSEEYQQVLDEALAGLRAWQRRYGHLQDLEQVFAAIGNVI